MNLHQYLQHEDGVETEKAALEKAFLENKEFVAVQRALLQLDARYQEVIALRYFEDKPMLYKWILLWKKKVSFKKIDARIIGNLSANESSRYSTHTPAQPATIRRQF